MAKLSSIPDGTIVKIPINDIVQDCYKVGSNHYGKGEVTLLAPGWKIFDALFPAIGVNHNGLEYTSSAVRTPPSPYFGSHTDVLLGRLFPLMLNEELRGSLVEVPISVFNVALDFYRTNTAGSIANGSLQGFSNKYWNTAYGTYGRYSAGLVYDGSPNNWPYPTPNKGEIRNRCAFLFSVSEVWGKSSMDVTYGSQYGSTHWQTSGIPRPKIWFDPPDTADRPSGYKTNSFPWLLSVIKEDILNQLEFRGGALVRGRYGGTSGSSDEVVDAELVIAAGMQNGYEIYGSASGKHYIYDEMHFVYDNVVTGMNEPRPVPNHFGFCLDGNCEVANATGGVEITKGTAIKTYRKLDGVWYRTI